VTASPKDATLILPDPDDPRAGYEHFGSFDKAFTEARLRRRQSLVDIRNELFVEARSSRHRGDDEFVDRYRELLPLFQSYRA
jgi:hypothetical protein